MKVKELYPELIESRKTTYLNQSQVTAVKIACEKKFAVKTDLEKELIIQQAAMYQQEKISKLQLELQHKSEVIEDLQIELDESKKWYSVKRVKNLGHLNWLSARKIWSPLKKWSIANDYQIISIFDANYGEVKTYHADAWKAVYGVEL